MRYAHFAFEGDELKIIPLGDIHIGSPQSRIQEVVKIIETADENVRFIFAGDVIDNALRDSISDVYEQTQNPHEALKAFTQLLDLAKGKVLGVISGNHELRDYLIAIGHGYTGARTPGGKINANARIRDVVINCDIYITGHTHQPSLHKEAYFEADKRNKKLTLRERYLLTIPAWLSYEKYAAKRFYPPASPGLAVIHLSGKKRNITINLQ